MRSIVRRLAGLFAIVLLLGGCSGAPSFGGLLTADAMSMRSLGDDRVELPMTWTNAVFIPASKTSDGLRVPASSFYFSDIPLDALLSGDVETGQLIHVDLLWRPKPGQTPMDSSATNAALLVVLIAEGRVGVYGGAGFATVTGSPAAIDEGSLIGLKIHESTLRLVAATDGFADLLSPAILTGSASATRDGKAARGYHMAASQFVTNALGRSMYVKARPLW